MTNERIKNPGSEEEIRLDILGTHKRNEIRITGTIHNQFAVPGIWLRGTLHCHLGGHRNPEWVKGAAEHYRRLGYDFLAGMDHNQIIDLDPSPDMLIIPGVEISGPGHTLAFGLDQPVEQGEEEDPILRTANTIRRIKERGGIAVLAHPFKSGYTWEQLNLLCDAGLDGIEIVNSNVRGKGADAGKFDQIWHLLLRQGRNLIAIGNDDAHGPHEDTTKIGGVSRAGWTGILAREFTVPSVLDAIREKRTYASEGPKIDSIEFSEDGKLTISTSPCIACHFRSVGGGRGGSSTYPERGLTSQQFVLDLATAGYRLQDRLVIILEDAHGRRAWTSTIEMKLEIHNIAQ
jgi:hypothetical protein